MNNKIISIDTLKYYNDKIFKYVEVKQDKIDDLDEIRDGAAKGKTALQSIPSEYVTETELSNKGYATISALNNKVDAINGKQLSTEDFTTALRNKLEGLSNYDDTELSNAIETLRRDFDNIVSGDTTTAIKTFNEVIAFLDGLTDTQDLEGIIASIEQQIAGKMDKVILATVATSGNYNDLTNKPTIPSAVTESTVSGWGFTKNTGTVTGVKVNGSTHNPSNGIVDLGTISADESLRIHFEPNFDLEFGQPIDVTSLIQQSMGKTPAELYEEVNTNGKETTLFIHEFMGGELQEISRVVDPSYSQVGMTYLSMLEGYQSATLQLIINPTQCFLVIVDILAGYNSVVAPLAEAIESKQDTLVSGTNIKTINGESVLGEGNIEISGGLSDANVAAVDTGDIVDDVNVSYATTAYVDELVGDINSVLESIINGGGGSNLISFTINFTEYGSDIKTYQSEKNMTWEQWVNSVYNVDGYGIVDIDLDTFRIGTDSSYNGDIPKGVCITDSYLSNIIESKEYATEYYL